MTQSAILDEETVGFETVRIGPDLRVSVDRPYVHEHDRVFGDVEAGWKRSNSGRFSGAQQWCSQRGESRRPWPTNH